MDSQQPCTDAILAVLRAAHEAGAGKLTRTQLTKFVYLLDLYTAEDNGGATFTGTTWRFLHFGPYAAELDERLDNLTKQGAIQSETRENADKEYTLFYLGEWSTAKTLESFNLSSAGRDRLREQLKRFGLDLQGLLNHVYFETTPMQGARPGEVLDFPKSRQVNWIRDVKPHRFGVADAAKAKRIRELVANMAASRRERIFTLPSPPIYDEHYEFAMADADAELSIGPHYTQLDFE